MHISFASTSLTLWSSFRVRTFSSVPLSRVVTRLFTYVIDVSHLASTASLIEPRMKDAFASLSQPRRFPCLFSRASCLIWAIMQVHVSIRLVSRSRVLACCLVACHWSSALAAMVQATHFPPRAHFIQSTRNTSLTSSLYRQPDCSDHTDGSAGQQPVCALRLFRREHAPRAHTG
jgi:hypothetical protein